MRRVVLTFLCVAFSAVAAHVWEKQEATLTAAKSYANPYTDATVWVDLDGPGFHKRVYGFWDGGQTFRVRFVATAPGQWTWRSGSSPEDPGLSGKTGSFTATEWSEPEKQANALRHGFIRATANQHALEHADGTPYFAIGDTWYAAGTNRFKWYDDSRERPIGPEAGFKDYVRYRRSQGYNWVNIIAAFPNWDTDGLPWNLKAPDGTTIRSAWLEFGSNNSAKNMRNEGGRPFFFPGKVPGYENVFPDINRINPEYFHYLDRKIDYLNEHGFVPFIEVSRRDASMPWSKYYRWPDTYARYIQYVWSRYQANNVVLSPVHLDIISESIGPPDYIRAIDMVEKQYGLPPFGTLLSANANPSTLENWGDKSWVTLHQTGNMREHNNYWYLTEIYHTAPHRPALNGEPYYAGYKDARSFGPSGYKFGAEGGTGKDDQYVRSAMYGNFLSGGYGGHVYGAEGIWGADIEAEAPTKMWDAFQWRSGAQMQYLRTFALSIGKRYQELEPDADLVSPNKTHVLRGYEGWAYASRTPDKNIFLVYFEKGCPKSQVRGALLNRTYKAEWFDPRTGKFLGARMVPSSKIGVIDVPEFPSDDDWALRLTAVDRFSNLSVAPGETWTSSAPAADEQVLFVLSGVGEIASGAERAPLRTGEFAYVPPGSPLVAANTGSAALRLLAMRFPVPPGAAVRPASKLMVANLNDVPKQTLSGHGPTTQFQLLMGTTESKRDKLAAASQMVSLFVMDFAPGGTNIPHQHKDEEEIYYVLKGGGEIVHGEGRYPAKQGDAWFVPRNTRIGFYSGAKEGGEHDQVLAVRWSVPK